MTLHQGTSKPLTATLTPEPTLEEHGQLIWKSYDESVATVDENGQITAVAPGFAYITVSSPYVVSATNQCIVEVLPCQAMQFTDVDTSQWYHEGIDFMVSKGLMNGVGDNRFQPNGILTRGQLVTILHRMAGSPAAEKEAPFTDVASGPVLQRGRGLGL